MTVVTVIKSHQFFHSLSPIPYHTCPEKSWPLPTQTSQCFLMRQGGTASKIVRNTTRSFSCVVCLRLESASRLCLHVWFYPSLPISTPPSPPTPCSLDRAALWETSSLMEGIGCWQIWLGIAQNWCYISNANWFLRYECKELPRAEKQKDISWSS